MLFLSKLNRTTDAQKIPALCPHFRTLRIQTLLNVARFSCYYLNALSFGYSHTSGALHDKQCL